MDERVKTNMGGLAATLDFDAELMLRVKQGDGASFTILLQKHRLPVIHFLYRMVQNQAVAEELAQEVFLQVYRSRESYEPTAKFTTWLFRIATHLALNSLRDGKNRRMEERLDDDSSDMPARQVSDHQPSIEQKMVCQARLDEIRRAVAMLPEKQRAAVLMHKYEEMEYSQIAKVLNCSESAIKSLLFRAYETLRARLAHMAGKKENAMNCPMKSGENADHLLDYASGKLNGEARAQMERHMAECSGCREFAGAQQSVWQALDAWEPAAVSMDFDRRLYQRIEQKVSWWTRFTQPLNPFFRHALPIGAAAGVLVVAGMLINRPVAIPAPPAEQSAQVESLTPDQVQVALDDMEMLREFNHLVPGHEPKM